MTQDDVLFGYRQQLFAEAARTGVTAACRNLQYFCSRRAVNGERPAHRAKSEHVPVLTEEPESNHNGEHQAAHALEHHVQHRSVPPLPRLLQFAQHRAARPL